MLRRAAISVSLSSLLVALSACDRKGGEEQAPAAQDPSDREASQEANREASNAPAPPKGHHAPTVEAAAKVGEAAPAFTLQDLDGNEVTLESFKGKTVVLEWFNPGCPFVKFAHGEGPLATMGNEKMGDELVWLAINSGGPGKQGHGAEANKSAVDTWKMKYPVLLDESGEVGKTYGAQKTPHVFVIDPEGVLRYRGALDNAPIGETQNEDYANFLDLALTQLAAGEAIEPSETAPYGCSVKYGS